MLVTEFLPSMPLVQDTYEPSNCHTSTGESVGRSGALLMADHSRPGLHRSTVWLVEVVTPATMVQMRGPAHYSQQSRRL